MKKTIISILLSLIAYCAVAQSWEKDTLAMDSSLALYERFISPINRNVSRTDSLDKAMVGHIEKNKKRMINGYRLRIFFDNAQNARGVSEQIAAAFAEQYPDIPVYRVYANSYFKVTVGDFRSKSDAMRFLNIIKETYPSVFLVKETFSTISDGI